MALSPSFDPLVSAALESALGAAPDVSLLVEPAAVVLHFLLCAAPHAIEMRLMAVEAVTACAVVALATAGADRLLLVDFGAFGFLRLFGLTAFGLLLLDDLLLRLALTVYARLKLGLCGH